MSDRSVKIEGNAVGTVIQTGDHNKTTAIFTNTTLPPAENVNIKREVEILRALFYQLHSDDQPVIEAALAEANHHLSKPNADMDQIGQALERALDYASRAERFAEIVDKLAPHVKNVCAWLGENWHKLLSFVGLAV